MIGGMKNTIPVEGMGYTESMEDLEEVKRTAKMAQENEVQTPESYRHRWIALRLVAKILEDLQFDHRPKD